MKGRGVMGTASGASRLRVLGADRGRRFGLSSVGAGGLPAYDRRVLTGVDRVEITVVIDNFLDLLMAGEEGVARYQTRDFAAPEQLVAEHGFSALVSVERDSDRHTVLYDAGLTPHAVARNLDVLGVPVGDLRAIVI